MHMHSCTIVDIIIMLTAGYKNLRERSRELQETQVQVHENVSSELTVIQSEQEAN
jgi:broad-specificity NMP kinase